MLPEEQKTVLKKPTAPKKLKATAGMKRIKVTWRKSNAKYVSGYEIAFKKKGAKVWRHKTVKGRAKRAYALKNLAAKKYAVKIRTVAKLGKVTRKSKWSKAVKATPYVAYGYYKATQKWRVYNQKSVEHGSVSLPLTYGTVRGSGCGLCAVAIGCHLLDSSPVKVSFKRWKISNFVKKLRKYEQKYEMVTTAGGSGWGSLKRFAGWLTVNGRDVKVKNATRTAKGILKELKKKHVVVVVSRGYCFRTEQGVCYDPGCGHYICFYGYKNGVFFAKDSWGWQGGSACKYTSAQLNRFLYDTRQKPAFTCFSMGLN